MNTVTLLPWHRSAERSRSPLQVKGCVTFHRYTGNRRDMMSGAPFVQTNLTRVYTDSKRPILISFLGHSRLQFLITQYAKLFAYYNRPKLEAGSCILQPTKTGGGKLHTANDQNWRWEQPGNEACLYDHLSPLFQYQRPFILQVTESWVGTWEQAKVLGTSIFCQGLIDPPKIDEPLVLLSI